MRGKKNANKTPIKSKSSKAQALQFPKLNIAPVRILGSVGEARNCVEYDTETEYDCNKNGCDSICRCGTITRVTIEDIYTYPTVEKFMPAHLYSPAMRYVGERWLNMHLETDLAQYCTDWEFSASGGYYGDELDSIYMDDTLVTNFSQALDNMLQNMTEQQALEHVLTQERNGNLPTELLMTKSYQAQLVSVDQINIHKVAKSQLDPELVKNYYLHAASNQSSLQEATLDKDRIYRGIPMAIVTENTPGSFQVIDGSHRMQAIKNYLTNYSRGDKVAVLVAKK